MPPPGPGLCELGSAPTTSQSYSHCVPCDAYLRSGIQLAQSGVVPLSWAPMDSQGYQDLRQYKEPSVTPDQLGRLRTMFALAFTRHSGCLAKKDDTRTLAVTYVPSTSGLRPGPHPLSENFISMLSDDVRALKSAMSARLEEPETLDERSRPITGILICPHRILAACWCSMTRGSRADMLNLLRRHSSSRAVLPA